MIAVIQCAATKRPDAGRLRSADGTQVMFVADPSVAPAGAWFLYAHPDDNSDTGATWRQLLLRYNEKPGNNPLRLCRAWELYKNPAYGRLVERFGEDRTYILSAGWGLIGASFLTPDYDITFSQIAKHKFSYKFRKQPDRYEYFCLLRENTSEQIVFFGGKDYVPLFCRLTRSVKGPRTIFYNAAQPPGAPGCQLRSYETSTRTNWHYECVGAFLDGRIAFK